MNVEYVYPDYVQAMLDKIDESIKHEDEWFSEYLNNPKVVVLKKDGKRTI